MWRILSLTCETPEMHFAPFVFSQYFYGNGGNAGPLLTLDQHFKEHLDQLLLSLASLWTVMGIGLVWSLGLLSHWLSGKLGGGTKESPEGDGTLCRQGHLVSCQMPSCLWGYLAQGPKYSGSSLVLYIWKLSFLSVFIFSLLRANSSSWAVVKRFQIFLFTV